MMLLEDVVDAILAAGHDRERIAFLVYRTVNERAGVMHERAQRAEGRAVKAERALMRLSNRVGWVDMEQRAFEDEKLARGDKR